MAIRISRPQARAITRAPRPPVRATAPALRPTFARPATPLPLPLPRPPVRATAPAPITPISSQSAKKPMIPILAGLASALSNPTITSLIGGAIGGAGGFAAGTYYGQRRAKKALVYVDPQTGQQSIVPIRSRRRKPRMSKIERDLFNEMIRTQRAISERIIMSGYAQSQPIILSGGARP